MDVGFEAGAFAREFTVEAQVVHDLGIERLAGDQERDPGRIRGHEAGRDPSLQVVDCHSLRLVPRNVRERLGRRHCRMMVRQASGRVRDPF